MKILSYLPLLFITCACASGPKFQAEVSSISTQDYSTGKVFIYCANSSDSDLQKDEYSRHIGQALQERGFQIVNRSEESDMTVMFDYGIDSKEILMSKPIYKWVTPQSYNVSSTTSGSNGTTFTNGTVREAGFGHSEFAGTATHKQTVYLRSLHISAYSTPDMASSKGNAKPIWETSVNSAGRTSDMRKLMPALSFASMPYLARTTPGFLRREFYVNDSDLDRFTKGISLTPAPTESRSTASEPGTGG